MMRPPASRSLLVVQRDKPGEPAERIVPMGEWPPGELVDY
jgi:hypothetical protein